MTVQILASLAALAAIIYALGVDLENRQLRKEIIKLKTAKSDAMAEIAALRQETALLTLQISEVIKSSPQKK